jgi:hypothetical protein
MIITLCRITEIIRHGFSIGWGRYSRVGFLEISFGMINPD